MVPFLNVRRRDGDRGENTVARMRAKEQVKDRATIPKNERALVGAPPSVIHASQTGTLSAKKFTGVGGTRQPIRGVSVMGGMRPAHFGD